MAHLAELKQKRAALLQNSDAIIRNAEGANRNFDLSEQQTLDANHSEIAAISGKIAIVEAQNTLRSQIGANGHGLLPGVEGSAAEGKAAQPKLTAAYRRDFHAWMQSGGEKVSAAMYEGSGPAGGYVVPISVEGQVVPLAPAETGVLRLATVIPTTNDLKVPVQTAMSIASPKAESGATVNSFAETGPTLGEFTLSAFMSGAFVKLSFELAQDVPAFEAFAVSDLLLAQQTLEEQLYVSGTGSGQPQGLLGNVGAGTTAEPDANGNLVSIDGILDLVGSLNAKYHPNASFLMSRLTSIGIRRAQRQANLFEPVFNRVGSQDYLMGYPVEYSSAMPTAARSATPVLFGDFKAGYVVGQRGGSGINVKILDQPYATLGQIALLAYRRSDGRVRRSEAIQSLTIAAS